MQLQTTSTRPAQKLTTGARAQVATPAEARQFPEHRGDLQDSDPSYRRFETDPKFPQSYASFEKFAQRFRRRGSKVQKFQSDLEFGRSWDQNLKSEERFMRMLYAQAAGVCARGNEAATRAKFSTRGPQVYLRPPKTFPPTRSTKHARTFLISKNAQGARQSLTLRKRQIRITQEFQKRRGYNELVTILWESTSPASSLLTLSNFLDTKSQTTARSMVSILTRVTISNMLSIFLCMLSMRGSGFGCNVLSIQICYFSHFSSVGSHTARLQQGSYTS